MSEFDLYHRVPRSVPIIVDLSNPTPPPPPRTPGLHQKISMPPSGVARAIFETMRSGSPRRIPGHSDEVLIRPGLGIETANVFELPEIGEMGVVNDKKLIATNLTRDEHRLISNNLMDGKEIILDGMGANVTLRVISDKWVVLGLFRAEVK